MVIKDKLFFRDEDNNRIYVTKEGHWYGINKNKQSINLNNMILLLEDAGFDIKKLEKSGSNVMLEINEEAIQEDFDVSK